MRLAVAVIVIAAVALSLAVYSRLPAEIPTHWNMAGKIDKYSPKAVGAFLMPAFMLGLAALFVALPAISPKGFEIDEKSRGYRAIFIALLMFMLGIHVLSLLAAMNISRSMPVTPPFLVGAVLIILGNYLPKVRRNFFIGIRSPWTLADEDVWFRTHRFGGLLLVVCGVLLMAIGPFLQGRASAIAVFALVVLAALASVIYSFVIYRRPNNGSDNGEASG
jgi:uncharacterized membrane protein